MINYEAIAKINCQSQKNEASAEDAFEFFGETKLMVEVTNDKANEAS